MCYDVEVTRKKIMSAVTDNYNLVKFDEERQPGISNLISILSVISNKDIKTIEEEFKNHNYGEFKKTVANEVCNFISGIQDKYNYYRNSKELTDILTKGAKEAQRVASLKLRDVRERMGIYY